MRAENLNNSGAGIAGAEIKVAERLKKIRLEKGMILSELAAAAGLSTGYLSRVENHRLSIPIASLETVAGALGVSISAFFEDESDRIRLALSRKGEGRKAQFNPPRSFRYEILVREMKGKLMEPVIVDIASGSKKPRPKPHAGEEFNYILEGECDMTYGKQTIRLREGDSVYYDATVPHCSFPVPGKPCRVLAVMASRDYLFHGDLGRLLNEARKK